MEASVCYWRQTETEGCRPPAGDTNVLVTGASGCVGGRLVPTVVDRGHAASAHVLDPTSYGPPSLVEVVRGDLLEPDTLAGGVRRL